MYCLSKNVGNDWSLGQIRWRLTDDFLRKDGHKYKDTILQYFLLSILSSTVSDQYHATDNIATNWPVIYHNVFDPDIVPCYQWLRGTLPLRLQQQEVDHWLSFSADVIKACRYASALHKQRYHIMICIRYGTFTVVKANISITAEISGGKPDFLRL